MGMLKRIIVISLSVLCVIGLTFYNATKVNTRQLIIREETVYSDKIDEDLDGFLIAFFSDVCYGSFINIDDLNRVVETVNAYKPDMIVFTGDLIDVTENDLTPEMIDELKAFLSSLDAYYGKFVVRGDHDRDCEAILQEIYSESGFTLLSNEKQIIGPDSDSYLVLTGIDPFVQDKQPYTDLLTDTVHYSIAAVHYPDTFAELENYSFDLCLAGHSLGGQIYIPIVSMFRRDYGCQQYYRGKIIKNGRILDITNGIGRRKTDARLWADAEVVFYTLRPELSGE